MRFKALALTLGLAALASTAWAQATPAMPGMHDSAMKAATSTGAAAAVSSLVNLNTATKDQLSALPGLKEYADKIIKARPFSDISQLVSKKIVPQSVFDKVKGLITVAPH
ncbi:MAG TPA: helix-hairpin-helix domain-containing protein [Gemmatimonadales bacterium]|nr:helix-hairpin-helix domain-containing protein [Gemmatimonadales bacterium]